MIAYVAYSITQLPGGTFTSVEAVEEFIAEQHSQGHTVVVKSPHGIGRCFPLTSSYLSSIPSSPCFAHSLSMNDPSLTLAQVEVAKFV